MKTLILNIVFSAILLSGCDNSDTKDTSAESGDLAVEIRFNKLDGEFSNQELQLANDCLTKTLLMLETEMTRSGVDTDYFFADIYNITRATDGSLTLRYKAFGENEMKGFWERKPMEVEFESIDGCSVENLARMN